MTPFQSTVVLVCPNPACETTELLSTIIPRRIGRERASERTPCPKCGSPGATPIDTGHVKGP